MIEFLLENGTQALTYLGVGAFILFVIFLLWEAIEQYNSANQQIRMNDTDWAERNKQLTEQKQRRELKREHDG